MLKIAIITNVAKYTYHSIISDMIQSTLQTLEYLVSRIDISTFQHDYECINQITNFGANVVITLDLSGFHIRTQAGEIALNMLPTKNMNIIWGHKPEYASFLNKKLSLSMLFYDVSGTDLNLAQVYPNMLYYRCTRTLRPLPITAADVNNNQKYFIETWNTFLKETLL